MTAPIQFRNLSIKWKINLLVLLAFGALLAAGGALLVFEWVSYRNTLASEIGTLAEITGRNCLSALRFDDPKFAGAAMENLSRDRRIQAAGIYRDGALWARYPIAKDPATFPAATNAPGIVFAHSLLRGGQMSLAHRIEDQGEQLGVIWMSVSLQQLNQRLTQYVVFLASILLLTSLVAGCLGQKLLAPVYQSLLDLTKMAHSVSQRHDYSLRTSKKSEDEIGLLIDATNEMLETIQKQNNDLKGHAEELSESKEKLQDYSENLELKVESRTAELRAAMAEAEKARDASESANRAKSTFLAAMSHELRTPLTAIIGFSEMLITDAEMDGKTDSVEDLKRINSSGRHLLSLINDILDISKVEAGKMELHLENFELSGLLKEVTDAIRPLVANKENNLVVERVEKVSAMRADVIKVRQCLFNLLSNANKFTSKGEVKLTLRSFVDDGETWVAFDVRDSGIGISPEQMTRLFKVFSQADESTSRKYGGTGLGLALTKQFCEMMGGTVTVQSELGKGSTFSIVIPARVNPLRKPRLPASLAQNLRPLPRPGECDLLCVDDDPAVHDVLDRILSPLGYRLAFAENGDEGVRLAREIKPAMITLDVVMPEMDGWMALSVLKSDPGLASIPVLLLSVGADKEFGIAMGIADYLGKPIQRELLIQSVKRILKPVPGEHVLIIEDDPAMREILRRTLEQEEFAVKETETAEKALEHLRIATPSLILLDLMLPGMDGFEFLSRVNQSDAWRRIPVIVVSAKDLTDADRLALSGRVETVLQKGAFSLHDLARHVQDIAGSRLKKRLAPV